MSEEPVSDIYQKLQKIQHDLKAPKNQTGRFGAHRSAEAILAEVKPLLDREGLALVLTDSIFEVGGRNYVRATATLYNVAGHSVCATGHAWEGDVSRGLDASQVTGMASSYARKYAMGGLLAIDDTKDADGQDGHDSKSTARVAKPAPPAQPATDYQKQQIKNFALAAGIVGKDLGHYLHDTHGVENPAKITAAQARDVIEALR